MKRTPNAGTRPSFPLSSPDRIYFPDLKVTKRELAAYYEAVADRILPELVRRPLTLLRCPEGISGECFYQKRAGKSVPDTVPRVVVKRGRAPYTMVRNLRSLVALVQIGVLELHVWGSRADRLDRPDLMIFDLDPGPGVSWARLRETAFRLRSWLVGLGLPAFLRLTGGKGLHVAVPLARRAGWDTVKLVARAGALTLVHETPDLLTARMTKSKRTGKIFVDYFRNDPEATAIASYSVRARPGAPVAVPVSWDEVDSARALPQVSLRGMVERMGQPDPWAGFRKQQRALTHDLLRRIVERE